MSRTILRSSQDWLVVALMAAATFAYFTAGSGILNAMSSGPGSRTAASVVARLVLAIIIAAVMVVSERRRQSPSVDAALLDGIQVAAVVIITNNLFGTADAGAQLAARTALVLVGLPLIAVLTHLLARRVGARHSE